MIRQRVWLAVSLAALPLGCSMAPKSFTKVDHPAPIMRARSVGLANQAPKSQAVPALINRLEDSDPVVRLVAYEELKKETGKSFGYVPWGRDADRASSVTRWKGWWQEQLKAGMARFR